MLALTGGRDCCLLDQAVLGDGDGSLTNALGFRLFSIGDGGGVGVFSDKMLLLGDLRHWRHRWWHLVHVLDLILRILRGSVIRFLTFK